MKPKLKKISEQVIVITGGSSGIGLAAAREAAAKGARVVVAGREENALLELVEEMRNADKRVVHVVADVSKEEDVRKIADTAIREFGRIDTWVNNAAVSIYGKEMDVPIEDAKRLFDVDFWGLVYGSRVAVEHMRGLGGVLINIGSVLSDRSIPFQGFYSAAKHAVKAFTETLRMELEHEEVPITINLIKPGAVDTPYSPKIVVEAILHAAQHPVRDLFDGPSDDGREHGLHEGRAREENFYTTMATHPVLSAVGLLGVLGGITALAMRRM